MPDENFNRSEFISEKVTDILGSAVSIINNSDDPIATAKELENIVKNFVETAIDTNAKTRSEAEEQFAKMAKRNWGIYLNGKYVVIDLVTQAIKYDGKILDISGSSIDEGNDKLTPIPDKDYLWYMAKRAVGVAIDVLTYYAKPLMPLTLVGMAINQNHKAKVEYIDKESGNVCERKWILINASSDFDTALDSVWANISDDMKSLDRVIFTRDDIPVEFIYQKEDYSAKVPNTFRFKSYSENKVISVFKRISYPLSDNTETWLEKGNSGLKMVIRNYLANYGANAGSIMGDLETKNGSDKITPSQIRQAAAYCLKNLKGYAIESDKEAIEYQANELTRYSQNHLNDRLAFYKHYIDEITGLDNLANGELTDGTRYYDTKTGFSANDDYQSKDEVIFVDGKLGSGDYEIEIENRSVYGYSNDDEITLIAGTNYVEGGLGSDTITTGSGDDTIYTNAHIDDKFDTEDESTTNTVHAGAGNDTIRGSNGIDKIYGEDGDDTIYGRAGDDILDGGKGIDHIFGGAGSDTIKAESGENYIYTHTDSKDGEDLDTEDDTNTVNITNGTKNFIYGGKGNDIVTITGGENILSLDNGDNVVTITNSTQNTITTKDGKDIVTIENSGISKINLADGENIVNITGSKGYTEITTGKDKDEITISGGRKTGTNTDVNISSGAGADIIHISQNTTNHINAGDDNDADEIYGGSGYDYYYVANTDTLQDNGGLGEVWFGKRNTYLTGGTETQAGSKIYIGNGFTYQLSGNTLSVSDNLNDCGSITINDYQKYRNNGGDLNINFTNLNLLVA